MLNLDSLIAKVLEFVAKAFGISVTFLGVIMFTENFFIAFASAGGAFFLLFIKVNGVKDDGEVDLNIKVQEVDDPRNN